MSVKGFASGKHHTHINVYFVSGILSNSFPEGCSESLVVILLLQLFSLEEGKKYQRTSEYDRDV